jgi:catecholate siderophore receptor
MSGKSLDQSRAPRRARRSPWLLTGAFVASTALSGRLAVPVQAANARTNRYTDAIADVLKRRTVDLSIGPSWELDLEALRRRALAAAPPSNLTKDKPLIQPRQDPPKLQFDILPGPLDGALAAFHRITGFNVTLVQDDIRTLPSPGVKGFFTPEQALGELLAGTAVHYTFSGADAVMLDLRAPSEFIEVKGSGTVVSSPKYTAPLREIPQTIAVIPRAVIEEQGATTLSETLRNVPGITLQAGEGGGASNTAGDMFNMRGFNASNSLFVDGVRDDGLISRDVFNIEQVEVFMGPTGSDVGRGTAAGYVNMITKTPRLGSTHSALFGVGTADQRRLSADFNWSLPNASNDSWLGKSAVRLNALWQDSGVAGRDRVELQSRGFAPSIALGLDTSTRVFASAQILRQENLPDYGIPGAAWSESPLTPTTVLAPAPVDQSNYYGSVNYDYDNASQNSYLGRVEHDINRNLTLRNQTRYNETHREAVITTIQNVAAFDPVTNLVTVARQGNERENRIVSNQTSLVDRFATGTVRHTASVGVEYIFEKQFAPGLAGLGTRAPIDIFAPNPDEAIVGYAPTRSLAESTGKTNTIGFYAFDTIELTNRWQVTAGARWEHYEADFRSVDATGLTTVDLEKSDGLLSGKVGVVFKAAPTANVYFSYGSTVTPPGTANFTLSAQPNNQNNPNVEPQRSTNLEVGAKWDFANGRLSLTSAVFHTENKNVIFTVDATAIPPVYNQDDAQTVDGVTVGVAGRLTDRWDVLAHIGFLDATFDSQAAANDGNRLTLTPKVSGSVWTTYRLPIGVRVGGGVRYTDDVFINAANTIRSPGYHLVDGLVEYDVNSHLSLRANIYNLTNEKYIRNVNNNGGRYNPGNPRSALLTTNVKF